MQQVFQYQRIASTPSQEAGGGPGIDTFVFFTEPARRRLHRTHNPAVAMSPPRAIFTPEPPTNPHAGLYKSLVPHEPKADRRQGKHEQVAANILNSLIGRGELIQVDGHSWRIFVTPAVVGSGAPTVNDDESANFMVGHIWVDQSADKFYVCVRATTGAAVWNGPY